MHLTIYAVIMLICVNRSMILGLNAPLCVRQKRSGSRICSSKHPGKMSKVV